MHEAASFGAVAFATGTAGETAAGISFVFTVSSFCTSAPEEREENHATERSATWRKVTRRKAKEKTTFCRHSLEEETFLLRAPKKSTWGFSERNDTRLRAQMRTEPIRRERGAEKRAKAKQRGPREGQGSQAESKGRKQSDASRAANARRVEAEAMLDFRESSGQQANGATPPQRRLRDSRRPTCTRAAANLGVPLPQQVRCRGAHRATNAQLAERAQA